LLIEWEHKASSIGNIPLLQQTERTKFTERQQSFTNLFTRIAAFRIEMGSFGDAQLARDGQVEVLLRTSY